MLGTFHDETLRPTSLDFGLFVFFPKIAPRLRDSETAAAAAANGGSQVRLVTRIVTRIVPPHSPL